MKADFSKDNDVLDIPVPCGLYTSPLAIMELPPVPPPPPSPRITASSFVRNLSIAAVALVSVIATTAHASSARAPRQERTMTSFHVDRHAPRIETKHEYARTALVPSPRRRR